MIQHELRKPLRVSAPLHTRILPARGVDRHAELVIASGAGVRAVVESAAGAAAHNGTSVRPALGRQAFPATSPKQISHNCRMGRSASEILRNHFRRQYGLSLGERTPSEILLVVRTTAPVEDELSFEVRGQGADGQHASVFVTRSEVRRAVRHGYA